MISARLLPKPKATRGAPTLHIHEKKTRLPLMRTIIAIKSALIFLVCFDICCVCFFQTRSNGVIGGHTRKRQEKASSRDHRSKLDIRQKQRQRGTRARHTSPRKEHQLIGRSCEQLSEKQQARLDTDWCALVEWRRWCRRSSRDGTNCALSTADTRISSAFCCPSSCECNESHTCCGTEAERYLRLSQTTGTS